MRGAQDDAEELPFSFGGRAEADAVMPAICAPTRTH